MLWFQSHSFAFICFVLLVCYLTFRNQSPSVKFKEKLQFRLISESEWNWQNTPTRNNIVTTCLIFCHQDFSNECSKSCKSQGGDWIGLQMWCHRGQGTGHAPKFDGQIVAFFPGVDVPQETDTHAPSHPPVVKMIHQTRPLSSIAPCSSFDAHVPTIGTFGCAQGSATGSLTDLWISSTIHNTL